MGRYHPRTVVWLVILFLGPVTPSYAQLFGAPRIKTTVYHPPLVRLDGVTKIAVSEFEGECGAELTDRFTELITNSKKFEVLDRQHVQGLLKEQDFGSLSGRVDVATAAKLGKIFGPAALVFGRVTRCRTEVAKDLVESDSKGNVTNYLSRTRANVTASIQLVDLKTSRVLSARTFDGAGELVNRDRNLRPEAPDAHAVLSMAYQRLIGDASPLILPWPETIELKVHNDDPKDKSWSLKRGAEYMKTGQFGPAVEQFSTVLDRHKSDTGPDVDKYLHKVLYDLGVALTYSGRASDGVVYLEESNRKKPDNTTTEAIAKAKKLVSIQQEYALLELGSGRVVDRASAPPAASSAVSPGGTRLVPPEAPPVSPAPIQSYRESPSTVAPPITRGTALAKGSSAIAAGFTKGQAQRKLDELKGRWRRNEITVLEYETQRREVLAKCPACVD